MVKLIQDISISLEDEFKKDRAGDDARWKSWVLEATRGGAGRAHKWSKLPQQWTPTSVRTHEGKWSGQTSDLLAAEQQRLAAIWRPEPAVVKPGHKTEDLLPHDIGSLQPITATMLREASNRFPIKTAETYDGFHVRHYGLLCDEALHTIALLLNLVEHTRQWPRQIQGLTTALIPKAKGGKYRGIALFPSLYRLWAKVRLPGKLSTGRAFSASQGAKAAFTQSTRKHCEPKLHRQRVE
jgi:hypothetical protein